MFVAGTKENNQPTSSLPNESDLETRRKQFFNDFPPDAPSNLAKPTEFAKLLQRQTNTQIFCNRPWDAFSTPVTLLHRVFGKFVDDCEVYIPDAKTTSFVWAFMEMMCDFYKDERARVEIVRKMFWKYFDIKLEPAEIGGSGFTTDGHASVGYSVYLNTEGKNEFGSTPADPSMQSIVYGRYHVGNVNDRPGSRFPCLHMYYFGKNFCFLWPAKCLTLFTGPYLGFAGSAFTDHLHYEPLSPVIPLWFSRYDTKTFDSVARIFGAFKNAVTMLKEFYSNPEPEPAPVKPTPTGGSPYRFPYPTMFTLLETGASTAFSFVDQIYGDRLLYVGSTNPGTQNIVVKFTTRYSKELHLHCSSREQAPPLLGCEALDGGWFMIVMDRMIEHRPLSTFNALDKARLSSWLKPRLSDLVHSFHEQDLVHGDLRDTNVLVSEDGMQVKLVDFDWGGKAGEVRYPSAINCTDFWRPEQATDGVIITKEHDTDMIDKMFL